MQDYRKSCPISLSQKEASYLTSYRGCLADPSPTSTTSNDFYRFLSFSPDGQLLLTLTDRQRASMLRLSTDIQSHHYYKTEHSEPSIPDTPIDFHLESTFSLGETVSDIAWHPASQRSNSESWIRLAMTMRDHPIHLIDEFGKVYASYRGHNHLDELDHTQSLAFNCLGNRLYAGGDKKIRTFDAGSCKEISCFPTHNKGELFGQKGLISCLSFNPDRSACYAAGCFDGSVSIYAEDTPGSVLDICALGFGVSQTLWSPCGKFLYISGRKHDSIHCWDIRHTKKEIGVMKRQHSTQQRMTCALDPWGCYLACGDEKGKVLLYDTTTFSLAQTLSAGCIDDEEKNHQAVNCVAFHPYCSLLMASIGSRQFNVEEEEDSDEEEGPACCKGDELMSAILQKKREIEDGNVLHGRRIRSSDKERPLSEVQLWSLPYEPIVIPAVQVEDSMEVVVDSNQIEQPLTADVE
eukprot:gene5321-5856_t